MSTQKELKGVIRSKKQEMQKLLHELTELKSENRLLRLRLENQSQTISFLTRKRWYQFWK